MTKGEIWENPATKRRIHGLLAVSGLLSKLVPIIPRAATKEQILRFHLPEYVERIQLESLKDKGGDGGEQCRFATGRLHAHVPICSRRVWEGNLRPLTGSLRPMGGDNVHNVLSGGYEIALLSCGGVISAVRPPVSPVSTHLVLNGRICADFIVYCVGHASYFANL